MTRHALPARGVEGRAISLDMVMPTFYIFDFDYYALAASPLLRAADGRCRGLHAMSNLFHFHLAEKIRLSRRPSASDSYLYI